MPVDHNLVLVEPPADNVDQFVQIHDELLEGHRGPWDVAIERFVRAALIPIDNDETLLEQRVEMPEQTHLRKSWAAVQQNENRIRDALPADQHPLIEPA